MTIEEYVQEILETIRNVCSWLSDEEASHVENALRIHLNKMRASWKTLS